MTILRGVLTTGMILLAASACLAAPPSAYNVRDYGAAADGKALATAAIQKAIDAAAVAGGGTVVFPPGTFRSGTIYLKSNVTLSVEAGATLLGSPDPRDYPENRPSLRPTPTCTSARA